MYSNITDNLVRKSIQSPLCRPNGVESDHSVMSLTYKLPSKKKSKKKSITFRPITKDGSEKFGQMLLATDWSIVEKDCASASAEALSDLLNFYVASCFPEKNTNHKQ